MRTFYDSVDAPWCISTNRTGFIRRNNELTLVWRVPVKVTCWSFNTVYLQMSRDKNIDTDQNNPLSAAFTESLSQPRFKCLRGGVVCSRSLLQPLLLLAEVANCVSCKYMVRSRVEGKNNSSNSRAFGYEWVVHKLHVLSSSCPLSDIQVR